MKINTSSDHFLIKKSDFKDLFNIMKICLFLLFAFAFQLMATNTNAQDAIIELRSNSVTVSQLISEIEKQTDYLVVYSNREVNTSRTVSLKNKSDKVSEYLNQTFSGTDIGYDFEKNYIVLSKRAEETANILTNLVQTVQQQGKTVRGTVTDSNGESVIGATIVVKDNPTQGTVTDIDGNYSITNISETTTLVFSFIGMRTLEFVVGNQTIINVRMEEESIGLEEVVAVGYGTQRKANLTGAVSSVSVDDVNKRQVGQTSLALQGLVPGMSISQRSGQPGADGGIISIRGKTTLGNNNALILVDGIEMGIDNIDPNMIESISVLKDASSAAIYGSRAANGVILITTKRAGTDTFSVSYDGYFGWQSAIDLPKMVNAIDHMIMTNIAHTNIGKSPLYSEEYINEYKQNMATDPDRYPNTNWIKETLTNNGLMQNHFVTLSGGSKRVRTIANIGYFDQM